MYSPSERVKVLRGESESLKDYLSRLPPAAWTKPSACEHWSVADIVAHLATALDSYTGHLTRGLQGDAGPPSGRSSAGAWERTSSAQRRQRADDMAKAASAYRESLADRLLPTFNGAIDGFNKLLAGLGPPDWDKMCYHGRGVIPVQTLVSYAILEICVHQWDIQSRLERAAHLPEEGLRIIIEHFSEYLQWTFLPDPDLAVPVRYRFQLVGTVSAEKDLVIEAQQARLIDVDAESKAIEASFRCDAEIFVLLMCGRTKFAQAIDDGQLVAEGAHGLASGFSRWFQGL